MSKNEQWADMHNAIVTQAYLESPIVTLSSKVPHNTNKVALVKDYYISQIVVQKENLKNDESPKEFVYYSTMAQCVEAVYKGKADYTCVSTYEADYYLSIPKYSSLQFSTDVGFNQALSIGISKSADSMLYSIIDKTISNITNEEKQQIIISNSSVTKTYRFIDMIYVQPVETIIFLLLLSVGILSSFIVGFMYYDKNRKNTMLQNINDAKTSFLARMSHEIRTPISAVIGMNNIILDKTNPDDIQQNAAMIADCSRKIDVASRHLLLLINDILDMTKINEGKFELKEKTFNIVKMVDAIKIVYEAEAKEKNQRLRFIWDKNISTYVIGDELRLKQVLINFIANAIKYNKPAGKIQVIIKKIDEKPGKEKILFEVKDTGIGIAEENIKKIFDPFERDDNDYKGVDGTGLGLSISKRIVELMHGKIKVESKIDDGSKFSFAIWLKTSTEKELVDSFNENKNEKEKIVQRKDILFGKTVLVVDDNEVNIQIIKYILTEYGVRITSANNGLQACKIFEESEENYFDAILMDVKMPQMNGYEATRCIRKMNRKDSKVPIIAVSANAFVSDMKKSYENGMNMHIAKPIDHNELIKTLEDLIENT